MERAEGIGLWLATQVGSRDTSNSKNAPAGEISAQMTVWLLVATSHHVE